MPLIEDYFDSNKPKFRDEATQTEDDDQKEFEALGQDLDALEEEKTHLENALDESEADLRKAKTKYAELKTAFESVNKNLITSQNESDSRKVKLADMKVELDGAKTKLSVLQNDFNATKSKMADIKVELEQTKLLESRHCNQLTDAKQELESLKKDMKQEQEQLRSQNSALLKKCELLKENTFSSSQFITFSIKEYDQFRRDEIFKVFADCYEYDYQFAALYKSVKSMLQDSGDMIEASSLMLDMEKKFNELNDFYSRKLFAKPGQESISRKDLSEEELLLKEQCKSLQQKVISCISNHCAKHWKVSMPFERRKISRENEMKVMRFFEEMTKRIKADEIQRVNMLTHKHGSFLRRNEEALKQYVLQKQEKATFKPGLSY